MLLGGLEFYGSRLLGDTEVGSLVASLDFLTNKLPVIREKLSKQDHMSGSRFQWVDATPARRLSARVSIPVTNTQCGKYSVLGLGRVHASISVNLELRVESKVTG